MDLRFEPQEGYLLVTLTGEITADEVPGVFRRAMAAAASRRMRRILFNFLEMKATFSLTDRLNFAKKFAQDADSLGLQQQLAVVGRPPAIDGLAALLLRNRGFQVRTYPTVSEALNWFALRPPTG